MRITEGPKLATQIAPNHPKGVRLDNPVMIASGTFGYDGYGRGLLKEDGTPSDKIDFQHIGAVVAKTVTMLPLEGNPEPRWYPTSYREALEAGESIFLNSVGLTNPGIRVALEQHAPMWATWNVPVFLSISGTTVEEFGTMAAMAEGTAGIAALELNLSCPNIKDGAHFSHNAEVAGDTVAAVKAETSLPVFSKLSPNVPDILPIAEAVVRAGTDGIVLSNTIPAMLIDIESRKPILGGITGGISGPALHPVALALVYRVSQALDVPIIGVGGIFTAKEALAFIMAGASAVQVGSANLAGLSAPLRILDELRSYMVENEIGDLGTLVGAAW